MAKMLGSFVYIVTNKRNGTLYTGVSSDLIQRVGQHKAGEIDGFLQRNGLKMLVWYGVHGDINEAIKQEKQIKKWNRKWKLRMIEEFNPFWRDLYEELL